MTDTITKCTCGRDYTHCKNCGRKSSYLNAKKFASEERSRILGKPITVYRCSRCGANTDETTPCQAGQLVGLPAARQVNPKPTVSIDLRPQFTLDHYSLEYVEAFNAKYLDMANSMKYRSQEAIYEAMAKDGWTVHPEGSIINPETNRVEHPLTAPITIAPKAIEPQGAQELSLDDVIEKMKKEAQ